MGKIASAFGHFAHLVLSGAPSLNYLEICRTLRVHPDDLDEFLYSELGCTGDELLTCIRRE